MYFGPKALFPPMIRPLKGPEVVLRPGDEEGATSGATSGTGRSQVAKILKFELLGPPDEQCLEIESPALIYGERCLKVMNRKTKVAYANQTKNRNVW